MKKFLTIKSKKKDSYILLGILALGAYLRLKGINWDQNQHLHPDERFLTMVTQAMSWPKPAISFFFSKLSTLNPYNVGYNFFVYGTFPLVLVKFLTEFLKFDLYDYNNITLVGRFISAVFDLGTLLFVFKIGKKIFNQKIGYLSAFLYAISVLPIQLSHFFTVDTFLVFFLICVRPFRTNCELVGI